ncbi:uncharacterized protein LOC114521292 [Dendronephthya gigantea]|uniref:uncharacterized protein LOC114521292 n=1 Tax=Dendronephthya gigantea TaxID=151771 RepID=UPI001068D370|nr:uncharacterized protein LOC114521292 [Dendronephthya gigantea]
MSCEDDTTGGILRRNKVKQTQSDLDPLALALNNFYENRVRLGLERKEICEDIAQAVSNKVLKKIETADNRFREKSVLSQGIPHDGLQAEESIHFDMLVQLSFGKSSAVFFRKDDDGGLHVQPESSTIWKDCLSRNGFLSADKVNKILRYYVGKAVKVLHRYIRKGAKEKLPKRLRSISMKEGTEIVLIVNKDITINLLPAFVLPDSRVDPARQDCPSSSHVVCRPFLDDSSMKMRMMWKWCFFVAEKNRIRALGGPSCRVQLLRILTEMRDTHEGLRELSSYHLKHVLFHETQRLNDVNQWASKHISERFRDLLKRLVGFLEEGNLPHYFMQPPDFEAVNLLEGIDSGTLKEMSGAVLRILQDPLESLSCEGTEQRQSLWPWELELLSP